MLSSRKRIGLDINSQDKDGWCALLYAVSARNHEFCKMLVLEGKYAYTYMYILHHTYLYLHACD